MLARGRVGVGSFPLPSLDPSPVKRFFVDLVAGK
jgi:hypothetical protein